MPGTHDQIAAYVVSGRVSADAQTFDAGVMLVAAEDTELSLEAAEDARLMVIGGSPVGARHLFWNFVSSSNARIEQAKLDWKEGRFDMIEGDPEFIPLPE